MTLFGMPAFSSRRVQDVWDRMCDHAIGRMLEHYKSNSEINLASALKIQDSRYDSMAIPEEMFENVKRVKLNTAGASDEPFRMARV